MARDCTDSLILSNVYRFFSRSNIYDEVAVSHYEKDGKSEGFKWNEKNKICSLALNQHWSQTNPHIKVDKCWTFSSRISLWWAKRSAWDKEELNVQWQNVSKRSQSDEKIHLMANLIFSFSVHSSHDWIVCRTKLWKLCIIFHFSPMQILPMGKGQKLSIESLSVEETSSSWSLKVEKFSTLMHVTCSQEVEM